jgi:hypothetical protein
LLDTGFTPATVTVGVGETVQWNLLGDTAWLDPVSDATGMGLYDSGPGTGGLNFQHAFTASGTFPYRNARILTEPATGTVEVPCTVSPAHGTTNRRYTVTWGTGTLPKGFVEDVQILRPGSSTFVNWRTGRTGSSATFVPAGAGSYRFRARERRLVDRTHSGWSPSAMITVRSASEPTTLTAAPPGN